MVGGDDGTTSLINAPVRPVRKMRPPFLPSMKLKNDLKTQWTPVFSMMEKGIADMGVPQNSYGPWSSPARVTELYSMGVEYLKSRASYIWLMPKSRPESWAISQWSKKLSRSEIEKNGNASDLEKLPAPKKSNRAHPFFAKSSMTVIGEDEDTYTPKKRQKSTVNHHTAVVVTPESSSNPKELLELEEDNNPEESNSEERMTENALLAHLGIRDQRASNEVLYFVKDSSIPDAEYNALRRNCKKNTPIPALAIRRVNVENLQSQGKMLDSFVVTAYFKILGSQYFSEGVRVVDDTFMKWLVLDTPEQMKVRYRVAMVDDGVKILLIPIFSGDITCGHYSLAVVDRLRCTLLYFGSLPALDDETGPITLKRLVDKGFADTQMVQGIYVAGGERGMIKQGMNTNDCGVFTCCLASA